MDMDLSSFGNFSLSTLIAGFLYGVAGIYILKEARKGGDFINFFIGIALMVYPIFVSNVYLVWGIGAALIAIAYKRAN